MEIVALFHGSGSGDWATWERIVYWTLIIGIPVGGVALLIYAGNSWKKLRRRKD